MKQNGSYSFENKETVLNKVILETEKDLGKTLNRDLQEMSVELVKNSQGVLVREKGGVINGRGQAWTQILEIGKVPEVTGKKFVGDISKQKAVKINKKLIKDIQGRIAATLQSKGIDEKAIEIVNKMVYEKLSDSSKKKMTVSQTLGTLLENFISAELKGFYIKDQGDLKQQSDFAKKTEGLQPSILKVFQDVELEKAKKLNYKKLHKKYKLSRYGFTQKDFEDEGAFMDKFDRIPQGGGRDAFIENELLRLRWLRLYKEDKGINKFKEDFFDKEILRVALLTQQQAKMIDAAIEHDVKNYKKAHSNENPDDIKRGFFKEVLKNEQLKTQLVQNLNKYLEISGGRKKDSVRSIEEYEAQIKKAFCRQQANLLLERSFGMESTGLIETIGISAYNKKVESMVGKFEKTLKKAELSDILYGFFVFDRTKMQERSDPLQALKKEIKRQEDNTKSKETKTNMLKRFSRKLNKEDLSAIKEAAKNADAMEEAMKKMQKREEKRQKHEETRAGRVKKEKQPLRKL